MRFAGPTPTPPALAADMTTPHDADTRDVLMRLLEEHGLSTESRLYREAQRSALHPTDLPGTFRLSANPQPSESVVDVYSGPGYLVQAESLGAGVAFAQTTMRNWQETVEMRTMQAGHAGRPPAGEDHIEVEVRLADILEQGGLMYPVESVTVERAWYFTLPNGSVEVREVS
jgi:hypothetical protein